MEGNAIEEYPFPTSEMLLHIPVSYYYCLFPLLTWIPVVLEAQGTHF